MVRQEMRAHTLNTCWPSTSFGSSNVTLCHTRKFARRNRDYMRAYRGGALGLEAESQVRVPLLPSPPVMLLVLILHRARAVLCGSVPQGQGRCAFGLGASTGAGALAGCGWMARPSAMRLLSNAPPSPGHSHFS